MTSIGTPSPGSALFYMQSPVAFGSFCVPIPDLWNIFTVLLVNRTVNGTLVVLDFTQSSSLFAPFSLTLSLSVRRSCCTMKNNATSSPSLSSSPCVHLTVLVLLPIVLRFFLCHLLCSHRHFQGVIEYGVDLALLLLG